MENIEVWKKAIEENRLPGISKFKNKIELEMNIYESGKPALEQIIDILNSIEKLDSETALLLPENFLYKINPRTIRKNARTISLRRIDTKQEAIEKEITPQKLITEKINEMRERFQKNPETLSEDYIGINYKGIRDKKIKNYLISDGIEGFLYYKKISPLIKIKRYDTLEELLRSKSSKEISFEDKASIKRELLKIRKRKMLVPEKAREIILTRQAERVVEKIPSRSELGKFYTNIKFRRLPLSFSEEDKEFYSAWTDFYAEPSCNCNDKTWFISYLRPNQIWHCVHEISAYRKAISEDWQNNQPIKQPYISASPFFKPSEQAIEFYLKLKNQVFAKKENLYAHLAKAYIDIWLEKQVRRGKIELM